ncbi:MAG: hypothetical protein C5B50_23640 [Verrucomicrobia bacterium]|nr:MAG: hypothetical protein C5B50_23640 [Verrucomicrobiota bacterium]
MKRVNRVLFCLGLAFLVYLVVTVGPRVLLQQIEGLGWGILLLIAVEGLAYLAHTIGWRCCVAERGEHLPLFGLFRMMMAGFAISYLTPTASLGGDVSKAALLASDRQASGAVSSVLVDKLMTGIAMLLLVLIGTLFVVGRVSLPIGLWVGMGLTTGILGAGMVVFFLLQKSGKLGGFCRWLAEHRLGGRAVQQAAQQFSNVDEALRRFYVHHRQRLVRSVAWHLLGHTAAIIQAWLFLWLSGQSVSLPMVIAAGFLSLWFDMLTFAVPMNVGTLEGTRIVVFKALGCQGLLGITFGLAIRITQVFWTCFGLASYALSVAGESRSVSRQRGSLRRVRSAEFVPLHPPQPLRVMNSPAPLEIRALKRHKCRAPVQAGLRPEQASDNLIADS